MPRFPRAPWCPGLAIYNNYAPAPLCVYGARTAELSPALRDIDFCRKYRGAILQVAVNISPYRYTAALIFMGINSVCEMNAISPRLFAIGKQIKKRKITCVNFFWNVTEHLRFICLSGYYLKSF